MLGSLLLDLSSNMVTSTDQGQRNWRNHSYLITVHLLWFSNSDSGGSTHLKSNVQKKIFLLHSLMDLDLEN